MKNIIKKFSSDLNSKFYFDYDTSKNVWFRTGGKVDVFCIVYDEIELSIILNSIGKVPYKVIGAGSNVLIRDGGYFGIIFKLGKKFNDIHLKKSSLEVGAAILDVNLSKFAALNKITNFEFFSGIPGTIGGAIKMNAGCFGFETKDILNKVKIINSNGKIITLGKDELKLSYRNSNLSEGDVITSANFNVAYGNNDAIKKRMSEIKELREKKQPIRSKTSGSTFKNPKNNYAAKLIEMADCKGMNVGDAYVSDKHANFLINTNQASANQIEELGKRIIDKVYKKFSIELQWEVKIFGNK